jgi:hypothetical protein
VEVIQVVPLLLGSDLIREIVYDECSGLVHTWVILVIFLTARGDVRGERNGRHPAATLNACFTVRG